MRPCLHEQHWLAITSIGKWNLVQRDRNLFDTPLASSACKMLWRSSRVSAGYHTQLELAGFPCLIRCPEASEGLEHTLLHIGFAGAAHGYL